MRFAIDTVFNQNLNGVALVGGTALAGYYAGHRRSDDIDLFAADADSFRATVLAVDDLQSAGVTKLEQIQSSNQYSKSLHSIHEHRFTIDIVLDSNFHRVAELCTLGNMRLGTPFDLLRMKMATLASRGSEKDLYDLIWLFQHFPNTTLSEKLISGAALDGGLTAESALIILTNSQYRLEACGFCSEMGKSSRAVFKEVEVFRKDLIRKLIELERKSPSKTGFNKTMKSLKEK